MGNPSQDPESGFMFFFMIYFHSLLNHFRAVKHCHKIHVIRFQRQRFPPIFSLFFSYNAFSQFRFFIETRGDISFKTVSKLLNTQLLRRKHSIAVCHKGLQGNLSTLFLTYTLQKYSSKNEKADIINSTVFLV